jgi:hypothetical protein
MARIGYARVSTLDQDLTVQLAALKAAGCDIIRSEKVSGSSTVGRDELRTVLAFISEGNTLVVPRVDRLARSIGDLQDIVREPRGKGLGCWQPSSRSIPRPPPERPSSTCSECSPSSRRTYVESARLRGSRRPRRPAFTSERARSIQRPCER